jgi:hypothetical protein
MVAQLFGSTGYVIEEKFLGDFEDLDPYLMAGLEGLFGFCMWIPILFILQAIPCKNEDLCPFGAPENLSQVLRAINEKPIHILWIILIVTIIPCLYCCALSVTKYGSAAQRSTIECARIPIVWLYFITVPMGTKPDGSYDYDETFTPLQLIGFLILFVGVLIYNEIYEIPFWKFNKYTKRAIAAREEILEDRMKVLY